jgi:cytochrome P450
MATSVAAPSHPTGAQLTVFDPVFREDPYPVLAEVREKAPIHYNAEMGMWVFTRHADVHAILRNPDFWSDPRRANPDSFYHKALGGDRDEEPSMLLMDDPGHRRLRGLVSQAFKPRAIEGWRERARTVARRHVEAIAGDEFDLIDAVANPVPTVVIAELLGVDPDRHEDFKTWSDAVIKTAFTPFGSPEDVAAAEAAREKLWLFFREEIGKRRSEPSDDLVTAMLRAEEAGDSLTDDEIILQCNLLLLAGNLTTSDLIGNAVMALVRNPDQQALLREDRSLLKNAVEEVLRYDSPVTNSGRIAHEDFEYEGFAIKQGDALGVSLAAANRDPAVHPDPDRFDVRRQDIQLQSFGGGRHFCLGAHLARLEAAETLDALLDRFSNLEMGAGPYTYAMNASFRGLSTFSVRGTR